MRFNWTEYIEFAETLAADKQLAVSAEARYRSAISRAYYAVFRKAEILLREKDRDINIPSGRKVDVHFYVKDKFENDPDRVRKGVGTALNRLRLDRNKADYADFFDGLEPKCKVALQDARAALVKLDILLNRSSPSI